MRFAYNSNGLQNHRLEHAVELLAEHGYDGIALTLDIHHLDPQAPFLLKRALQLRQRLEDLELGCVIETGARFLLDPREKHEPTLVSPDPERRKQRVAFLKDALDVAHVLEAECVSCFAGVAHVLDRPDALDALLEGLEELRAHARAKGTVLALEPEPGMVVNDLDDVLRDLPPEQAIALDVGHCLVTQERDPADAVLEFAARAATITVEDMARGEHLHLPFGEGDIDLPSVLQAIQDVDWKGLVCVEMSRESHRAHTLVPETIAKLRAAERELAP